jgi:hypothetical protein
MRIRSTSPIILAVLAGIAALTGCGPSQEATTASKAPPAAAGAGTPSSPAPAGDSMQPQKSGLDPSK